MSDDVEWSLTAVSARSMRETVGRNLRRARQRAEMKREDLADRSNVSLSTIARMEAGRQEPRLITVIALCFALGVSLEMLLAGLPEPHDVRGSSR
jgi:transcriptional regulator with XRE-family HTH domain